jgi:periplasmic protein TonB
MEAKKNPSKDLSLQRNKFFLIGLTVSISLAITAFEWRTVKITSIAPDFNLSENATVLFPPITTINPPVAPQPNQKIEPKKITSFTTGEIVPVKNNTPIETISPIDFEPNPSSLSSIGILDPEPEDTTGFFLVVEKNPEPVNGYKDFYTNFAKNLRYPRQARQMGTEGKVFVEFIVNKNGEPSDLKIIRGIGSGCDEEAMRVLSLTKWEPGKQRGKPVRVKMAMQLNFKLN